MVVVEVVEAAVHADVTMTMMIVAVAVTGAMIGVVVVVTMIAVAVAVAVMTMMSVLLEASVVTMMTTILYRIERRFSQLRGSVTDPLVTFKQNDTMKTKHTKGPWIVAITGNILDGRGRKVVSIESITGNDASEKTANARLIAAAPELLGALKALLDSKREHYGPSVLNHYNNNSAVIKARDAIAKATAS